MAMVGDIARRLSIANASAENILEGEGVVLIDEIDLHLHPSWQAVILPVLLDTFPNLQFIQKDKEPDEIVNWKKKFKNKNKRKPYYKDIKSKPEKQQLKESLIREQKYLCCYCCNRISDKNSHIQHFVPQSIDKELSLEYTNLHASCQGEKGDQKHCGHAKENEYNETLLISPLDENCENRFAYLGDGKIVPFCNAILYHLRKDQESAGSK